MGWRLDPSCQFKKEAHLTHHSFQPDPSQTVISG